VSSLHIKILAADSLAVFDIETIA